MKLVALVLAASPARPAGILKEQNGGDLEQPHVPLVMHHHLRRARRNTISAALQPTTQLGNAKCPCIGFDDIEGKTTALVGGLNVTYPADLGGSCEAWDESHHPDCNGKKPEWCQDKWCYVDPKDCDMPVMPKKSSYQPEARYQNLPLYYSYSTCGAEDLWSKAAPDIGLAGCRCIGFDNSPGTTMVNISGEMLKYPAEIGGECSAWDFGRHPDCLGEDRPDWCEKKWCFVDPCSCTAEVPPKVSTYLGKARFQGNPVFWSYATCSNTDSYSSTEQQEKSKGIIAETCRTDVQANVQMNLNLGMAQCRCIGFDGINGSTAANASGHLVTYPADLGGSCEAWDKNTHPDCRGTKPPSWCNHKWCYVDPKSCEMTVTPKISSYQPKALYQSLPLYYSYATCGGEDAWTKKNPEIGLAGCRCIGFENSPGITMANVSGQMIEYPAEIGGDCSPWDSGRHPDCLGAQKPDWCEKKWCLVDPCSCTAEVPPKVSTYLGKATFKDKPIFWSYSTCLSTDSYSSTEQQEKSKDMIAEICHAASDSEKSLAIENSPALMLLGIMFALS